MLKSIPPEIFAPPFAGPRSKVDRARRHINDLDVLLKEYGQADFGPVSPCGETDDAIVFAPRLRKPPPHEFPLILGDAAHNLRSALDLMMCDVARLRNKSSSDVKFPFAKSATELKDILRKKPLRKLGGDVQDAILSLAPYKGGNRALRGLHDLDVADKHKIVIPVYSAVRATVFIHSQTMLEKNYSGPVPSLPLPIFHDGYVYAAKRFDGKLIIATLGQNLSPMFGPNLPFSGAPIVPTLKSLAQLVDEIIDSFAAQFGRGDGNPPAPP